MNGWIKYYSDSTTEIGSDEKVQTKQASWSKSKLDQISKAELEHNKFIISIKGSGNYWQSDDWEADQFGSTKILIRRLAKQIDIVDNYIYIRKNSNRQEFVIATEIPREAYLKMHTVITPELVGQWFLVELNVNTNQVSTSFSKEKI